MIRRKSANYPQKTMKRKIKFLFYPLAVFVMGLFVIAGCNDDDTEPVSNIVTDIDGNEYKTTVIGNQEWMAENLRVTKYNNGDDIPTDLYHEDWTNTTEGAYAIFPHEGADGINSPEEMVEAYGKLYNWYAVVDTRGLCPQGWSVPSADDWTQLADYVVSQGYPNDDWDNTNGAGNALKSCRQIDSDLGGDCDTSEHPRWISDSDHYGFDEFGFSALPGGHLFTDGFSYSALGGGGRWWSSSESSSTLAFFRRTASHGGVLSEWRLNKTRGFSVRCVREVGLDDPEPEPPYDLILEVYPAGAGIVTGGGEYQEGEQVDISATAEEGWGFLMWIGDTEQVDDPFSPDTRLTMPSQNVSLTARFQQDPIYGEGVTDIDGNEYLTVIIGDQEWMAENLRVTNYNNGDPIPTGLSNDEWGSTTEGAYAINSHENADGINSPEEMVEAYGKLYNWYAVADTRGLCPQGWSVPSDNDWTRLVDYVVAEGFPNESANLNGAGNALKSCRQINSPLVGRCNTTEHPRWISDSDHYGFDEFGFSALPGGARYDGGFFTTVGSIGSWWSATKFSDSSAWSRAMRSYYGTVSRHSLGMINGYSVRCIKD